MTDKKTIAMPVWSILIIMLSLGLITACGNSSDASPQPEPGLHTQLLVSAPNGPLPANRPIIVQSHIQDIDYGVSHAELYIVEMRPSDPETAITQNLLIHADAAPFDQVAFTASQIFVPQQAGEYLIKVRGYNRLGEWMESEFLGFTVVN